MKRTGLFYAAYELQELLEAFERAARIRPQWRAVPIVVMFGSITQGPWRRSRKRSSG